MAALLSTGLETTPSSDLRLAGLSPRELGMRLAALGLATGLLLLLTGSILLKTASGLQPDEVAPGVTAGVVSAPKEPAPEWAFRVAPLPSKLPRERVWDPPAIR
jgi:hypothetical protein